MKETEIISMEDKGILRAAMKEREVTQIMLADKLGMRQGSVSGSINRTRMGLDTFTRILNTLGYDVVIKDTQTGEDLWKVEIE